MSIKVRFLTVIAVILTLIYPLAIWLGLNYVEPRIMAVLLLLAVVIRVLTLKRSKLNVLWLILSLVLVLVTVRMNVLLPLKLYPVLVNVSMLAVFGYSLLSPPSMVERIAALYENTVSPTAQLYMRRVTQVWCVFFIVNGLLAFMTAVWASAAVWSLYNGLIAYVLMGLVFAIEYCVRLHVKRRHHAT
jgi:uncharacterized membrane protein